ncbi:NADP-dependent oxidoreductase [Salinimicrobium xinjiangense]|uniref:NADP-dependent oxidoreductase n=1 Tax=Salinimicrobium xinjiangense TaxID=438596 RepID=UPI0003F9F764|nr:NADP-dependent oxidoreductase [Salinimicrobium xinjiangense]
MKKKMRAARYDQFGGPKEVKTGEIEIPELKEGEVLVKIKAAGVNPVDAVITKGYYKDMMPHSFPVIPGWDFAGVIEERGHAARRFEVGEEVYAYARRPEVKWGTFAEYIIIPDSYLATRPKNVSMKEAAAIPLAGLTAYQALYIAARLSEGQKLLILGSSGGVGSFGIQLAKAKGAEVIGVASSKNHEYMRSLGADHTIDYKDKNIGEAVKEIYPEGVDLIFDCTSGDSLQQSLKGLKKSGKLVSILNQGEDLDPNIDFEFVFVEPHAKQLESFREMVEEGKITVKVNQTYSLEEAAEALKQIETLHTTGKIVVVP